MNWLKKNLVFIGYRGVGKTTLGTLLAQKYQKNFVDLDQQIETRIGPIDLFWTEYGEEAFRIQESKTLKSILPTLSNTLFACGGGTPLREENVSVLKNWGKIIWLNLPLEQITPRLRQSKRPALTSKKLEDEVLETWTNRFPLYQKVADFQVCLVGDSISQDLARIESALSLLT